MKKQLEIYLNKQIPISLAFGVKVEEASLDKVVLFVPLENNINHKKTVFGGSLHAVATLACWSLLHLNLKDEEQDVQIVITKSDIVYHAPIDSDFRVECSIPEESLWDRFIKMLRLKGKARIQLFVHIYHHDRLCVDYKGTFAGLVKDA